MFYESDTVKVKLDKVDKLFFSNLSLIAEEEIDSPLENQYTNQQDFLKAKEEAFKAKEELIKSYKRMLKHKIGVVRECDKHRYRIQQMSYFVEFPSPSVEGEIIMLWFLESELYLV